MLARTPARVDELRERVATLDVEQLVKSSAQHGLSALVADALSDDRVRLPPEWDTKLQADARARIAAGLKMKRLTLRALDALAAHGVRPVLLKGLALAQRLYPQQPLARPASDVDVLVGPEALEATRAALATLGLFEVRAPTLANVFEEHHHLSFYGEGQLVEVHFRLFSGFGGGTFDDEGIRARARPFTLEGRAAHILAPEDEFCYLATHVANHSFLRASWLVDLQRFLLQEPALDFDVMAQRARKAGFFVAVAATLSLLESLLDVRLPHQAATTFKLGVLRHHLFRALFSKAQVESSALAAHRVGAFASRLLLVDSSRHALRAVQEGLHRFVRGRRRSD